MPVHFNQHYQILCKHLYAEIFDGSDTQPLPQNDLRATERKDFVCWWLFCFTFVVTPHFCSCFPSNRCSAQWVCPMTHPRSFLLIGRKPNQSERDSLWKYLKHVFILWLQFNSTNTLFVWYVALFCQVPLRFEFIYLLHAGFVFAFLTA